MQPLARAALAKHDLAAAAAAAATSTVELAVTVRSSLSLDAVAELRKRLDRHDDSLAVTGFFDVADVLLPA